VATAQKAYAKHPTAINAQKLQIAKQKQAQGPTSLITARNTLDKSAYGDQTKAGKEFAHFTLDTLQPATKRLHAAAQDATLPGVERGLKSPSCPCSTGSSPTSVIRWARWRHGRARR
jgi:hypothetical protein